MRITMLILLICILTQTAGFGEMTKQDLEEIQKVVKEEISESEQRRDSKFADINTEIKVIQTDIKGVKDRLDDTNRLVLTLIFLIAGSMIFALGLIYSAKKLAGAMTAMAKLDSNLDGVSDGVKQSNELLKQDTAEQKETNRLLNEYTKKQEEYNMLFANIQAKIEELVRLTEESRDESSDDTMTHAPAD